MVTSQDSTQTGLLNLIAELRGREKEQEYALEEIRLNIQAVQTALELLRERYGIPGEQPEPKTDLESLRGMTLLDALTNVARDNRGRVKVNEVKRAFVEGGIIGNPKTAYQRITSALIRSNKFEWSARGEYKLVREGAFQERAFQKSAFQ